MTSFVQKVTSICLAILLILYGFLRSTEGRPAGHLLPPAFRVEDQQLSGKPIVISSVRSCDCLEGPRGQAQRKFKFTIANHSQSPLFIGGGDRAAVRLLVAYNHRSSLRLTVPDPGSPSKEVFGSTPLDEPVKQVASWINVDASQILDSNDLFSLPSTYTLWAIPPNPNKVVETLAPGDLSFPTFLTKETLLPGDSFGDERVGYDDWVFYFPLPSELAGLVPPGAPVVPLLRRGYLLYPFLIIVGIAVFSSTDDGSQPSLIGFAPAPSDNEILSPSDL